MKRRAVLLSAAALSAGKAIAAGNKSTQTDSKPRTWALSPQLIARNTSFVWDLSASLPPGTRRGGRFFVDKSGAPLPRGVKLSPQGILSITDQARAGSTEGVVFGYTEPK